MKKITFLAILLTTFISFAQVLNQPANWPNANWTITGSFDSASNVFTDNPTISSNFSFDEDEPGESSINNIAAESDIIDLTAAFNAGETSIDVKGTYVLNIYGNEELRFQYWDNDAGVWQNLDSELPQTAGAPTSNFCNGNSEQITRSVIISSFTPSQLSNFRYRILYDDNSSWGWGFCFDSPTITSSTPPTCPNISNLNLDLITLDSVNLSWDTGGSETSWEVAVQTPGTGEPTGSGVLVFSNDPYTVTGLSASTGYEVYVRGYCGGTDYGDWIGPINFLTLVPARINYATQNMGITGFDLAVVDMNGDHLDDIVSVTSTNVNIHYQQNGGGFNEVNISTPNADFLPTWSMAAADFDGNGYTDLLYGNGSGVTFMKANNTGTAFTEISGPQYVFSQRSNFVDINRDGHLDAFVCHDVEPNVYYINDGSGNFSFYQSGVTSGAPYSLGEYPSGGDYGSIWIDYDNDRDMDMFIAKCGGEMARRRNAMLTYDSNTDTYTENAGLLGLNDPIQSWSSAWGDFDNDGDMDVFVSANQGAHKLMRNNGDGSFTDVTSGAGVSSPPNGYESITHDIDNDGNLDVLCNGTILYGKGDMTFEDADDGQVNYKNGSIGDLNNNGFIDAFYNGRIYWNLGNNNNFISIKTVGTASNIDGIGARVEIYSESGTQIRDVRSGEGFEFMSSMNTHFGLGSDTNVSHVIVYWPNSGCEVYMTPTINQEFIAVEGDGASCDSLGVIDESLTSDLKLSPNPASNSLTITTGLSLENAIFNIYDISGRRVMTNSLNDRNTIDVSNLSAGNYILSIISNNKISNQKFIKQ